MRKPISRDLKDRADSPRSDDSVVVLGNRPWNRKDMGKISSDIVRASVQSGKAIVLREFVTKDGVVFKPRTAEK